MKQKTNGKIVIAILAMFAVAASVIGFTYAYFTATFTQNNQDKTIEVTAGKLMARYTDGVNISIKNVVPGWISDNLHYYNVNNITDGKITTSTLSSSDAGYTELTANPWAPGDSASEASAADKAIANYRKMGLSAPLKFSVANISEDSDIGDKIYYYIRLNITGNGVRDFNYTNYETTNGVTLDAQQKEEYKYVYVSLYRGEFVQGGTYANDFDGSDEPGGNVKLAGRLVLGATGSKQVLVKAPESIAKTDTPANDKLNYFIVVEYLNKDWTQVVQGVDIDASVEVIGGSYQLNADGTYDTSGTFYDADNNPVTFVQASEEVAVS